jgi:hypothetical protein
VRNHEERTLVLSVISILSSREDGIVPQLPSFRPLAPLFDVSPWSPGNSFGECLITGKEPWCGKPNVARLFMRLSCSVKSPSPGFRRVDICDLGADPCRSMDAGPKAGLNRHFSLSMALSPFVRPADDSVHRARGRRAIPLLKMLLDHHLGRAVLLR